MAPLLTLDNFSLSFVGSTGETTPVLHDINLAMTKGQTHALVGESGSGKSVTALSILRLLDETNETQSSGSIRFEDQEITTLNKRALRQLRGNRIAMIFQEPMTSLNPVYTIGNQLIEPLTLHQGLSKKDAYAQALQLLERTGIENPEYRISCYPHQLSGGQRQRVIIAMALACRPTLLIADEPTTALDVTIQQQILRLIKDIQVEFGMSVLLITHDLPMVRKIADQVSIMHQGNIVEQGDVETIFTHPRNSYTKHLLAAVPQGTQRTRQGGSPLIAVEDLCCSFHMKTTWTGWFTREKKVLQAVDTISFSLNQGTTLGLVGESGSGKSTLALCLLGLQKCTGKVVYTPGKGASHQLSSLNNKNFRPLRKELQIVFQDPFSSLSPRMTIGQIVAEGLRVHGIGGNRQEQEQLVAQALIDVELDPELAGRFPHEFSGGQRQRIAIARALILRPKLLILDEPTSALDMTIQKQILELLKNLQERYQLTYIFITHDLRTVRSLADQLAVMRRGRIVEAGPAAELFAHPQQEYTKRLFDAAFHLNKRLEN
ncbi:ABC transporter ATP-binding protein [Desulfobulbus rhabdoformis]|uniref:ABC transporter ATP-binding protein n=1 Tax=Desulfobulbus rhabdoformis TaxID=34032 RepID=UPI001963B1D6|nr:dipeptide ABC transporter ATP-binding protein [Desulfobulbus rhabdoformis]MBM9614539.1 ABC transporter ATP-binding protein [Desulfobulbus rhabdoformis]